MFLKDVEIFIYELKNNNFELLGTINQFSSLIWPVTFQGYGSFELWAAVNQENNELLKPGNMVWIGLDNACIIECIKPQKDKNGIRKYYCKGRSLEKFLEDRIIWGTYAKSGKVSDIMYDLVNVNCINPVDNKRVIPFLKKSEETGFGEDVTLQKTGGSIYDICMELTEDSNIGFNINFNPKDKVLEFKVLKGEDRTVGNTSKNLPIELSSEFDDILYSEYFYNDSNLKNIAFIQGEANEGKKRKDTSVGAISTEGYNRKELYIDARDIQSVVFTDGEERVIPEAEYIKMLQTRGIEKLGGKAIEENFTFGIRQKGIVQYELGVDYNVGDYVTVVDKELEIMANVQITKVDLEFSDRFDLRVTFGRQRLTILDRFKLLNR